MNRVYTNTVEEYGSVRERCGLVDYSGVGVFRVSGPAAAEFLGQLCTRSVDFLLEGQIMSALTLDEGGSVIADLLIHCGGTDYLVEVWPTQREATLSHFGQAAEGRDDVSFEDLSQSFRVYGLEGPQSFRIAQKFLPFSVASMAYRSFVVTTWRDGTELVVSRTGVSGEYGYKLRVPAAVGEELHEELLESGATPCGMDALDICRMEMRFVNLEDEGGKAAFTPFDVALQWMVDFQHEFNGKSALLAGWELGLQQLPVCWTADERASDVPDPGCPLTIGEQEVGHVTHAVWSPTLDRVIGTAAVDRAFVASGLQFGVGEEGLPARTVSAPFLVATSFGIPLE